MPDHVEEPKNFAPKQPVDLDPPKDDPISLDYLSKCDGELCVPASKRKNSNQPVFLGTNDGYPTLVAIKVRYRQPLLSISLPITRRTSVGQECADRRPRNGDHRARSSTYPRTRPTALRVNTTFSRAKTRRGRWRSQASRPRTARPSGRTSGTRRRRCWRSGSRSSASGTTLWARCRVEGRTSERLLAWALFITGCMMLRRMRMLSKTARLICDFGTRTTSVILDSTAAKQYIGFRFSR